MRILSFKAENTYSFKTLDFDFQPGLHIVLGENRDSPTADSNQSGKSNIFESLCWTLYGKGTKEVRPDGTGTYPGFNKESVIHSGKKSCSGVVTLEDDGKTFTIERTRKKSGPVVTVKLDDKIVGDSQEDVDRLLGMTYETFVQSVFFAQGTKRFTQAKDSEIKSVMDDILGLNIYPEALKKCRTHLKNLKSQRDESNRKNKLLEVEIGGLEQSLSMAERYYKERLNSFQEFEDRKAKKIEAQVDGINLLNERGKTLGEQWSIPPSQEIHRTKEEIREWEEKRDAAKSEMNFAYKRKEEIVPDECPTCEQEVSPQYYKKTVKKYDQLYEGSKQSFENADLRIRQMKIAVDIAEALDRLSEIEAETMEKPDDGEVKKLRTQIGNKKAQIVYDDSMDQNIQDLEVLEEAFGNSGIKSLVLDNVLPILNDKANEYASILLGNHTELVFDTETKLAGGAVRDKFSVGIKTDKGEGYALCSGGERRRIDFSVALALQSLLPESGLFVCDEPFESVDETGQRAIVNLLRDYADERKAAVYVVSHEPVMKTLFDSEITVIKENGVSSL
jgi:DNA repair exonuclease SbcCD ATPase subunit